MAFDTTENLFSYGTLQSEAVQLATFGRRLEGTVDRLIGYRVILIPIVVPISKQQLPASLSATHHRNIQFTGIKSDIVEGTALTITKHELELADNYERVAGYIRVLVQPASGKNAWVYLHAGK